MSVGIVSGVGWGLSVAMVAGLGGPGGRYERELGGERDVVAGGAGVRGRRN